ncbi:glycosyltransferase [Fodinicola feengrottensis]
MRILMATTSGSGHFQPMLPFGAAFRRAGHEVLVAAPRSFAGQVERAGYPYWPCDDIADEDLAVVHAKIKNAPPGEGNLLTVGIGADLAPRAILPRMLAAVDQWRPDLVFREVAELGSALAAELRGVPQLQVLVGLEKFSRITIPVGAPLLARVRESVGLPPDEAGDRLRSLRSVSLLPPSFEESPAPSIHRFRDDVFSPAGASPSDEPLVYVTFGTVAGAIPFAERAFRATVDALADLPVRVLATGADAADFTDLPANVRVEKWVPQDDILRAAAVMVCHGGMGTVLGALRAGVPLVVVPQFADHPDNAARVEALGAGLRVGVDGSTAPADPDAVRAAVVRVLADPSFRSAAQVVAREIASLPPADEVVGSYLTGGDRPRRLLGT